MEVTYSPKAAGDLSGFSRVIQSRIASKIEFYARQDNCLKFAKKLTGHDAYRFRIGNYRVIFDIDGNDMFILAILKRDVAYRGL
jgi:mRNA interferase RelE/StbE